MTLLKITVFWSELLGSASCPANFDFVRKQALLNSHGKVLEWLPVRLPPQGCCRHPVCGSFPAGLEPGPTVVQSTSAAAVVTTSFGVCVPPHSFGTFCAVLRRSKVLVLHDTKMLTAGKKQTAVP